MTASNGSAVVNACGDSLPLPPDPNGALRINAGCSGVEVQYGTTQVAITALVP